jgi:hypothetical protein
MKVLVIVLDGETELSYLLLLDGQTFNKVQPRVHHAVPQLCIASA